MCAYIGIDTHASIEKESEGLGEQNIYIKIDLGIEQ
jgi:hypothetical protein